MPLTADAPHSQTNRLPPGALTTFDEGGVLIPGEAQAPKKRRGRPPEARAAVVRAQAPLTGDEMAFLRAWVQGVGVLDAARHYLPHTAQQDARSAGAYLRHLLARLQFACQSLAPAHAASGVHPGEGFAAQLQRLRERARAEERSAAREPAALASEEGRAVQTMPSGPAASGGAGPTGSHGAPEEPGGGAVPTLEDFAHRFPADMYSEAELIELYQEEFADATAPPVAALERAGQGAAATTSIPVPASAVDASRPAAAAAFDLVQLQLLLDTLGPRVSAAPAADSLCAHWLEPGLAAALLDRAGVDTLGKLARWVNARGPRWHDAVPGVGRQRAARLVAWLCHHEAALGVRMRERLRTACGLPTGRVGQGRAAATAPDSTAARDGAVHEVGTDLLAPTATQGVLVPLAQLAWPADLLGTNGTFRQAGQNTLGARDDREAMQVWLHTCVANKSGATRLVSHRALERLVLWALVERRRALSSLTTADLVAFREFLYAPPEHWCSSERVMRSAAEWRPLRGPLGEVAVRQILGVVQRMYAHWHAAGYLRANAAYGMTARRAAASAPSAQQALTSPPAAARVEARSFTEQNLQVMRRTLESLPDGAARRRLRAILCLFLECGLRRSEVQALTFAQVHPVRVGDFLSGMAKLQVPGKGGKWRELPLSANTLAALHAHLQDRRQLVANGILAPEYARLAPADTPLLGILKMVRTARRPGPGSSPADAPRRPNPNGGLSGAQIYTLLKTFFAEVANRADLGAEAGDFRRASTHWLRHTFAHRVLASGSASLPTVQALMGHSSIATTGVYLGADLQERARATAAVPGVF